ncbi:MAG: DNA polymerase III subunit gamma/tau [Clostridiales bacterium]|jgi:DNA polymerase-3 subunit gamma/tau|nr:DNA polymerase III subunit gamma/tau [Clostridiales bacterium]
MYTALYRKLRPIRFSDIIDQQHIVRTLTNQIIHGRVSHAYLFCGVRGTGKTSCAKIFARAVNCTQPNLGEACGICASCVEIARGASMDVIEIDAASNNGVDNIRDLREEVRYPPNGKYKVYIIDEVHMLSTGAFNALLKTLEEPPPQVIFILATTDPQKIPATIHSRLMRFDFHRISPDSMTAALAGYMADEGIIINEDALAYVVNISDGAMRDALSLLDRLAGLYFDQEITLENALEVTGSMSKDVFVTLFHALLHKNPAKALGTIDDISAKGRDFAQFTDEFLGYLRDIMVSEVVSGGEALAQVVAMVGHFSQVIRNIKQAGSGGRLALEIACIEWIGRLEGGDKEQKSEVRKERPPKPVVEVAPVAPAVVAPAPKSAQDYAERIRQRYLGEPAAESFVAQPAQPMQPDEGLERLRGMINFDIKVV